MALHLKPDFAKLCGLTTGNLTNYVKRGKVVMSGDYIDDSLPINKEFLGKRRLVVVEKKVTDSEESKTKTLRFIKPDPGTQEPPNVQDPEDDDFDDTADIDGISTGDVNTKSMVALNKKKLVVEIKKREREIELLRLREEKLKAIVIPTDLVKVVISQHSRSIATEFKNSIDNMLTQIAKKADLNRSDIADLRGKLMTEINSAIDKSVILSKKNVENIVREFVDRKEVGERN